MTDEEIDYEIIYLQVCENCKEVQFVFMFDKDEYYPVVEEWMEECFIGEHVNGFINDPKFSIEYIGYCCIECEIEDKGWII